MANHSGQRRQPKACHIGTLHLRGLRLPDAIVTYGAVIIFDHQPNTVSTAIRMDRRNVLCHRRHTQLKPHESCGSSIRGWRGTQVTNSICMNGILGDLQWLIQASRDRSRCRRRRRVDSCSSETIGGMRRFGNRPLTDSEAHDRPSSPTTVDSQQKSTVRQLRSLTVLFD